MGVDRTALEETQTPEAATQRLAYKKAIADNIRRDADPRRGLSEADMAQIDEFAAKSRTTIPEANYQDVGQNVSNEPSSVRIANVADKVSNTGAAINKATGEDVAIKGIASIDTKSKTMKLELADGTIVDSNDISYESKEQAVLYESALNMGYTPQVANSIIQGYTPNSNISVVDYLAGTNEAFHYGWGHVPEKGRIGSNYKMLTESQRDHAVKVGEEARAADDKARGVKASQNQPQVATKKAKGEYGVRFAVDEKSLTGRAKESAKVLEEVAKALKVNIVVDNLNGDMYGYYKVSTNEIVIDANAGGKGKNTLLFTASHELVHYIRNWSPAKFTVLADFLMEQYAEKGEDIEALIRAEINKAARYGAEMTYNQAYEEVVAQGMQSFLTDSNFIERLAVLQEKDASLVKKLVSKLKKILDNIRTAYQGLDPTGRASEVVKEMGEAANELYAKMEEALIAASEASQTIGSRNLEDFSEAKNTEGDSLFQYKAMEADEEAYRQMLKKHGRMSESEINKLFITVDKAMAIIKNNLEVLDYAWEADIDDRAFSPVKPNSDNLYKVSLDFSTLCRKRILQQVIQTQLQDALNKPLSREESIAIRDELMKIQEEGRQIEIACALCYVESARMKSPAQIKKFLKDRDSIIKEFLASKSGGDIKQKIKQAEAEARERLGVGNATLKSMPEKAAKQIRAAKKEAKKSYTPTAEEQKLIDAAKSMSVTDFTSPEGLGNLAKNYPVLFDAYTSFVRNATKSKGIEKDTWWRAGDSDSIGDTLIANMNRENGLRSQSWSDFQVIHMLDYIAATIELSTRNAKEQAYSKAPDYIELMGNTGVMLNMSLIPMAKFNGKLEYDSVEGMAYKKALELREKYHATAGTICIGISDEQIKMLLDDSTIDYVIPYHKSGMAAHIRKLMHIPTWSEYEKYQNETNLSRSEALKQAKKYGVKLLSEKDDNYQKHTAFSEWFNIEEAKQIAEQENAFPSDAKLQKKLGKMYGGYMAMQNAANNYLKLCAERGIAPKFSHENANFTEEANYWKLIIDRKMVDNVTGEIIEQQAIKPIFDESEVLRILNDELERYPKVKADQDYATRTVVDKFLSGEMNNRLDADTIAAIMQKPVDNITTTNIVASEDDVKAQYSDGVISCFSKETQSSFEIKSINDYVGVQKSVIKVLSEEGFFSDGKNVVVNKDSGMEIELTKDGIRETIGKGSRFETLPKQLKILKLSVIRSLPKLIETARLDNDNVPNYHNISSKLKYAYFSKDVMMKNEDGEKEYTVTISVRKSPQKNLFWIHKVMATEKEQGLSSSGDLSPQQEYNKTLALGGIISQDKENVKTNQGTSTTDLKAQYADTDSEGNKLSEGQQEFFKDSKVRDKNGNLMVVYHGSPNKFFTFRQGTAEGWGEGIYFTDNKEDASEFGDNVTEAYLNIKNPFNADTMSYYDIGAENTKAYQDFDRKYWQRWWYGEYDTYEEYRDDGMGVDIDMIYTEHVDVFNKILRELGYDGIIAYQSNNINGFEIVAFNESQPKLTTNENPTSDPDIRYQYVDEDAIDNRTLLAKSLEGAAKNDVEKTKLKEYQSKIELINAEEKKLRGLREQIKEISFSKGTRDTEKLKKLQFEAKQSANRINVYDKQLLKLEATKPLMDVLQREKDLVRKKMDQKRKEAVKAAKEKDMATMREIMNRHTESRKKAVERRDMAQIRNKIKSFKAKLESNLLTPTDRGYVPFGLAQAMIDVCSLIDTDTDLIKKDGNINKSQAQRNLTKEKLQALKDEYEKLKDYDDPIYSGEFDEAIYYMLKDLKENYEGRNLKEMSLDELRDMYDILRSIGDTLADARNLIGRGEAYDVYEAGDAIISEQREIAQKRKKDKRSGTQKTKDNVINLSLAPVRNVERMSGYKEDSVLVDLFNDFEIGVRQKNFFEMEAKKSFEAITTGKNAKAYESAIYDAFGGKEYMDDHGRKFSISKMQMMQAILSQDREKANNMYHIKGGGLVFADLKLLQKGDLKEAISSENSHLVSNAEGIVEQFRQELADDKWAQEYMAVAKAFFDGKAKDAINNTTLTLKHRIVAKDKNYIPFEVDKNFVVREISAANDIQQTINSYGMLQATKDKAPQPLIMTGLNNIVDRHIDQVATIVGLAIPVRNFNKVWNVHSVDGVNTTVNNAIEKNWGAEGKKFIEQVVQDIQGPRKNAQSKLYRSIKSGYIGATFLLNGSVVAKQIGSMFSATSMLRWRNPASMMANLMYTMANYKKIANEVDKYTAAAWVRRQGMSDAEVYTLLTEGKKNPVTKALDKAPAIFNPAKWITAMDSSVALSLWKYAKQDVKKAHPELSGEELNRATASFYDALIENTQSMTDVLHRPEIQKRTDILSETLGMFKTDLYQMAGNLQNAAGKFSANKSKENKKQLGKTLCAIMGTAAWEMLMTTAFAFLRYKPNRYRDDEEDAELTVESILKRMAFGVGGNLSGYVFPLLGGEIASVIEAIEYGESDDALESIALSAINDTISTIQSIGTKLKDGETPTIDDYRKILTKSLQVFGVPANNILRTVDAIRLHGKDIANGEFLSFEAGREKSNGQRLYEAILRGNEEQIEEFKLEFDGDDAINNALVKAIRENNPDVVEAASGLINSNLSTYESVIASLVRQGFSEDVAVRAVRSVVTMVNSAAQLKADGNTKKYDEAVDNLEDIGYDVEQLEKDIAVLAKTPSDPTDDSDEVESIYKASDINTALENGDTTAALKVIDDIVQVKIENYISDGYKKSEAKKKAEASVKSSVTSYWKPLYLEAKANKDLAEVKRIKAALRATKLYDDITKTTDEWWVAYKKSK